MKFVFAAAAIALSATPAFAQDFAGPRVEARLGWDRVGATLTYDDGVDTYKGDDNRDDVLYGVGIGYDFATEQGLLFGAEVNFDLSGNKTCTEVYGDDAFCIKARRDIEVGVRSGYVISNRVLVYGKLAYANGSFKASYDDGVEAGSLTEDLDAIRIGAGVEAKLSSNLYAKVEYRYTDYSDIKYSEPSLGSVKLGFDRNQVVTAIGYRF